MVRQHGAARVRLTDQALVAVTAARQAAADRERHATVVDLLVALSEAEGVAAGRLGAHMAALTRVATRAPAVSPRVAPLDEAVRWAAGDVRARPLSTDDLMAAALEIGGSELADALEASGLSPEALWPDERAEGSVTDPGSDVAETFGWDPAGVGDWPLPCARALARARAAGGSATALAVAIVADPQLPSPADLDTVARRLRRLLGTGDWRAAATAHADDSGADAVREAADRAAPGGRVDPLTLTQATLMAGGSLPARLLEPVEVG